MIDLSIIVVNTQQVALLSQCLKALVRQHLPVNTEIIVVDNHSNDGSPEMVEANYPQVRLVRQSIRQGPAANYNAGFRRAQGEFVVGINEDTEVEPDALWTLYRALKSNSDLACVGPRLIYPNGSPQLSCSRFPSWTSAFKRLVLQKFLNNHWVRNSYEQESLEMTFEPDWIMATCLMYRRQCLEKADFYDESLVIYYEELDMARRLRNGGWKVGWIADAVVKHHHGVSNFQLRGQRDILFRRLLYQSRYRYFLKHFGRPYQFAIRALEASLFGLIFVSNILKLKMNVPEERLKLSLYWQLFWYAVTNKPSIDIPQT